MSGGNSPYRVVVSAATHRLLAGFFDCHAGGLQSVKGVSAPVQVYRVLSESSAQSRLDVELSAGKLTPLVGRAHEVGLILERWVAAQAGDGQVMTLSGEPGIGKSRLVQEVKERVVQEGATCLEFRCSPYTQNSAFSPVLTHLQRVLQFERDDTPESKLAKLQQTLTRYHFPQADTLSLLAALALSQAVVLRGWALAEQACLSGRQGQGEEGIAQIRQGLAAVQASGTEPLRPYHLALLAEAYGKTGQVEEGLTTLAKALSVEDNTGERFYAAELWRIKGELLLTQAGCRLQAVGLREKAEEEGSRPQTEGYREKTEEAEACFLKAIDIARQQQAKSWELRAAMSLARLWQQQGKQHEARTMLAEVYHWFTEGFDTTALQEAKALLEELKDRHGAVGAL